MSIKFKDVAHHYIGCEVIAPLSFYDGFTARLVVNNNTTSFANGVELQCVIAGHFPDLKPKLKPLESLTDEVFERDYAKFEKLQNDCLNKQDMIKCSAALFSQLLKDGYDLFGLIDSNEAVAIK